MGKGISNFLVKRVIQPFPLLSVLNNVLYLVKNAIFYTFPSSNSNKLFKGINMSYIIVPFRLNFSDVC